MKRSIARVALAGALALIVIAAATFAERWLPAHWGGGLCGGLGALIVIYALPWFDRRWPKPKAGWAE